ncbi:hypothetical protein C8R43DRAFT_985296 [Mycena crocata]|nr:hypothetical protein C8R43DRAFT_985296 [Mycena crocata]
MLILDVKTRWSSTHQMLRRALQFRQAIFTYVAKDSDLREHELTPAEWEALTLVTNWLKNFRSATTQIPRPNSRCFLQHTPYFVVYSSTSRTLSKNSRNQQILLSAKG